MDPQDENARTDRGELVFWTGTGAISLVITLVGIYNLVYPEGEGKISQEVWTWLTMGCGAVCLISAGFSFAHMRQGRSRRR